MAKKSPSVHRAALAAGAVAVLGLLTACGNDDGSAASSPRTLSGTAAPASGEHGTDPASASASASASGTAPGATTPAATTTGPTSAATSKGASTPAAGTGGGRCHTSELRASVGRNNPGAGQENFPVVLTNASSRTCTVRGYPGAAFLDGSGKQLGPDPTRTSGTPATVTLKPGKSAWAGLTFSNPEISGAKTATPVSLLVTPPDEKASLTVTWKGGQVPVSGNASSVRLTVFSAGTGV